MDKITAVIMSWQAVMLSFAAFAILGVVRGMGTKKENGKIVGGWAQSRPFKMLLPIYPYALCMGIVFIPGIPMPEQLPATIGAKLLYAVWCGWFSDKVYQVIKSVLEKGFNMQFASSQTPSPPAPKPPVEPPSDPPKAA